MSTTLALSVPDSRGSSADLPFELSVRVTVPLAADALVFAAAVFVSIGCDPQLRCCAAISPRHRSIGRSALRSKHRLPRLRHRSTIKKHGLDRVQLASATGLLRSLIAYPGEDLVAAEHGHDLVYLP